MGYTIVRSDPRYHQGSVMCQGCRVRVASDTHHKRFRSQGGTDDPANLIKLCRVCHAASHGLRLAESDGFSCRLCPRLKVCTYGRHLYGLPIDGMEPLWAAAD